MFAQDVSVVPGTTTRAFGFCFPPPVMVGPLVQHLAACKARAVVVVPDTRPFWFPLLAQATTISMVVSRKGQRGVFFGRTTGTACGSTYIHNGACGLSNWNLGNK